MKKYLNITEAAEYLSVAPSTLRRWDKEGVLKPITTTGKHRRYTEEQLDQYLGAKHIESVKRLEPTAVTYARCSTIGQKQHGDIERQSDRLVRYVLRNNYRLVDVIKDCGSGLNDKRKGFQKLLTLVTERRVNKVIIEHKDRLTRFGFDILQYFFKSFGVDIELLDKKEYNFEEELTNDMMMLLASFSGKMYSKRAKENRLNKEQC